VEHRRPGRSRSGRAGRPRSGRAGVGCGTTGAGLGGVVQGAAGAGRGRPRPGRVRSGPDVAGVAVRGALGSAHGSDARHREARERKGGAGTIPAYVRRADTSADKHKQAGLRGGHGVLGSSATRRTYVTYVGLKTDERNSKYERRPR
jgi:hypothetical protein